MQDGYVKYNRNPNYFGEIMLYASFNIVAQSYIVWAVYSYIWGFYFMTRMIWKDYQLSRKEGWEEYKQRTWLFLFKIYDDDFITVFFYLSITALIFTTYNQGGIEVTLKKIFN